LILEAGKIIRLAEPGQFVNVRVNTGYAPLLRRPLSIHRARGKNLEVLYEVVGEGTRVLSHRKPGEYLDIIGPLGEGFGYTLHATRYTLPILIAGGIGVAPLLFLAEKIKSGSTLHAPRSTLVLIGAKTKDDILCEREFKKLGCEVKISTDDGSRGFKGKVTDLLDKILASRFRLHASGSKKLAACSVQRAALIYACGPRPMLKEISQISEKYNIPAQISLEEHMACGIGACLGCAVKTKDGFRRACKDGPVFNTDELIWRAE